MSKRKPIKVVPDHDLEQDAITFMNTNRVLDRLNALQVAASQLAKTYDESIYVEGVVTFTKLGQFKEQLRMTARNLDVRLTVDASGNTKDVLAELGKQLEYLTEEVKKICPAVIIETSDIQTK